MRGETAYLCDVWQEEEEEEEEKEGKEEGGGRHFRSEGEQKEGTTGKKKTYDEFGFRIYLGDDDFDEEEYLRGE